MTNRSHSNPRGFSLIEVLMSIFILGIGVISIAALFPAGIAQQRQSTDDVMGPIVAGNALAVLRTKLEQDDFGSFEEHGEISPRPTVDGDWSWMRPAFIFPQADPDVFPMGAIDIFNGQAAGYGEHVAYESVAAGIPIDVPYSTYRYGATPPAILITQQERYYPQATKDPVSDVRSRPQYVWDCMFRRFQGRVQVAIFVYRVSVSGRTPVEETDGRSSSLYTVAPRGGAGTDPSLPPLPIWLDLTDGANRDIAPDARWDHTGPNIPAGPSNADNGEGGGDDNLLHGFNGVLDVTNERQAWQAAGQWIVDQRGDVHRVLSNDGEVQPVEVELIRAIVPKPTLPVYFFGDIVTDIWYLPIISQYIDEYNDTVVELTPVYVTVKEL